MPHPDSRTLLKKPPGDTLLPAHWQRGRKVVALLVLAATVVATYYLRGYGLADSPVELPFLMARFTLRQRIAPPQAPDPHVIIVNMDDRCADHWTEPFIGWGGHIADAIHHLHVSGARVIALDWVQPNSTKQWFPGNDDRLAEALNEAGSVVMIKIARKDSFVEPYFQLRFALPSYPDFERDLGYAELNSDQSVITSMTPAIQMQSETQTSFAGRIAEHYLGGAGHLTPEAWVIPGKLTFPLRPASGGDSRRSASGGDSRRSALINYVGFTGTQRGFRHYSMYDVTLNRDRPDPEFRDKIAIIGVTYDKSDRSFVPFLYGWNGQTLSEGDEIQANQVRTLLAAQPIREPGARDRWLMAVFLGLLAVICFYAFAIWRAAIVVFLMAVGWVIFSFGLFIAALYSLPIVLPLTGLALGSMMGLYRVVREEGERRAVIKLSGTFMDPRVVIYLLRHPEARGGEGHEIQATVLFADLKNFTKTVEHLSPTEALEALNAYLALMASVILEHGGIIDKFLGDGLMAQWGAPEPREDHAEAAVRACLDIYRRVTELTASMSGEGNVSFGIRLTLHSGPVIVGFVGAQRLEFTIIGDTVNVTSRLQETAKELGCEFLISESVYQEVRGWVRTGQETEMAIRGRDRPLRVYEVLGEIDNAGGQT